MSEERILTLEQFTGWSWDSKQDKWNQAYEVLLDFYRREGTARVPFDHMEAGFKLGGWVRTQRKSYAAGKMLDERLKKLTSLKEWTWNTREEGKNL